MCDTSPHETCDNKCSSQCLSHTKVQMHDPPHQNKISSCDILCKNIDKNISKEKNILKLAVDKECEPGGTPPPLPHSPDSPPHSANNTSQPQHLYFKVMTIHETSILPCSKSHITCRIQFPKANFDLDNKYLCFTSEDLEPHNSLLNLSIYPQILPSSSILNDFELLYNNLERQTIFLSANHLVCYCIQMTLASAEDMERAYFLQPNLYLAARILNQNTDSLISPAGSIYELKIEQDDREIDINILNSCDANKQQRKHLIDILLRYKILFSSHTWSVGQLESTIDLRAKTGVSPTQQRFVPVPRKIQLQCTEIITRLLQLGLLVENNSSPWRSNILFLIKPPKTAPAHPENKTAKLSGHNNQNGTKWKTTPNGLDQLRSKNFHRGESRARPGEKSPNDKSVGTPNTKTTKNDEKIFSSDGMKFSTDNKNFNVQYNKNNVPNVPQPNLDKIPQETDIPLSRIRIVLDMSMINQVLKRTWPSTVLPRIEDIFSYCHNMRYLSKFDLTQSFWSKKVSKSMQDLSTFYFMGKAYSLTRLAQGSKCSSEVFQASINKVLLRNNLTLEQNIFYCGGKLCKKLPNCNKQCGHYTYGTFSFIDDIFVVSKTEEDHYMILEKTLKAFADAKLKVKLEKTELFITSSCDILGYTLDLHNNCIKPCQRNIQKILNIPAPTNYKRLQKFIGAVNFYCHLIPNFSNLLAPLTDLLKTNQAWQWNESHSSAFQTILNKMAAQPVLYILDPHSPIFAVTDACLKRSIAYCQLQWNQKLNTWTPIRFQSHKLSGHMINYSQAQVEALALATYCSENYPLLMTHTSHAFTDSRSLTFIARFRYDNLTIWRYHLLISSLPIIYHWLPCESPLLVLCDLFTREKDTPGKIDTKQVLNKRLPKDCAENLQYLDFSNLPCLDYIQVIKILDTFHDILKKKTPEEALQKIKKNRQHIFSCDPSTVFSEGK